MNSSPYEPVVELTRGKTAESCHFGALTVVDAAGQLVGWYGDPATVTFLRSTAKPIQALPFIEGGGADRFGLLPEEIALLCASHSGTDEHVATLGRIQQKIGVGESDLLCGVHPPIDEPTAEAMRQRSEQPTPNRHNCSGKHTGMLGLACMNGWPLEDYIDLQHPVQQRILQAFAEMCGLAAARVRLGIDGCSAPNFAVPLQQAALAFARLCDPGKLPRPRAQACRTIATAMMQHPLMVAGPGRFDTRLMELGGGLIVAKGGAEGYQGIGLLPGALGPDSPALGIALKIADGDLKGRARALACVEVLRQLGALSREQLAQLSDFGPGLQIHNWRGIAVGQIRPCFQLQFDPQFAQQMVAWR